MPRDVHPWAFDVHRSSRWVQDLGRDRLKKARIGGSDGPAWREHAYGLDFRVGRRETGAFELAGGPGKQVEMDVFEGWGAATDKRAALGGGI